MNDGSVWNIPYGIAGNAKGKDNFPMFVDEDILDTKTLIH